jgi:catalase
LVSALATAAQAAGAKVQIIAPMIGGVITSQGKTLVADHQIEGGPSILFDAVVIAAWSEGGAKLALQAAAVNFLRDAFGHLKVIGYTPECAPMLVKAGIDANPDNDLGLVALDAASVEAFLESAARGRVWAREPTVRLLP